MKPSILRSTTRLVLAPILTASAFALAPAAAQAQPANNELAGRTVFLDPGHQGSEHAEELSRQVDNGRGGTKPCQTTGMTTLNGVPEHTVNWEVTQLVKSSLESLGARVVLSRADDTGWGGCVDERAAAANRSGAALAVSIHADGAPADQRGFHLIVPALPIPDPDADRAQSGAGRAASTTMRDAYVRAGFSPATYGGAMEGIQTRADIAGPALTHVPAVFVEMGNGANPEDAAVLESPEGQLQHAIAITTGIAGYLLGLSPGNGQPTDPARAGTPPAPAAPGSAAPARTGPGTTAPDGPEPGTTAPDGVPQAGASTPTTSAAPTGTARTPSLPRARGVDPWDSAPPGPAEGPITQVLELLRPLAKALGLDERDITTGLVDLAYRLAGALTQPAN
ncbi:N-acetylmuramoyl-L-alanine amidase [Nocardia asteroides]|uniref:N-acetylmuramoyl-L-alanine amidase n=1 Tax=Nocardia asteroides TaxID=1824 RepID=UPI001E5ECDB1|nr:N-acetylmuramoyl-L-alanine amidase [Nocardia asteroides]UGT63882.1 N-acetylmuramoyl-L-alanine amidase [Nocardia asteroides]